MKCVKDLKKKLDLSESQELTARFFPRNTRNTNYILDVNGIPKYFMKIQAEGYEKERRVYDFLSEYPIVKTLSPIQVSEGIMIFPFIQSFKDGEIRDSHEFISRFHNQALQLPSDIFEKYFGEKLFSNHYLERFVNRINRHREMVENFWEDSQELEDYYHSHKGEDYDGLPLILVHGDIQHKNLQINKKGERYLIDFEDAYYSSPSWDLARPLMDLHYEEMDPFVDEYLKRVGISDKKKMRKVIYRDFLVRVVTDAIGRQQRFEKSEAQRQIDLYKERYSKKLTEVLKN